MHYKYIAITNPVFSLEFICIYYVRSAYFLTCVLLYVLSLSTCTRSSAERTVFAAPSTLRPHVTLTLLLKPSRARHWGKRSRAPKPSCCMRPRWTQQVPRWKTCRDKSQNWVPWGALFSLASSAQCEGSDGILRVLLLFSGT